ncbi:MAG: hypothetical protein ABFS41_19780 [Myxococcota bacterium]
MKKAAWFFDVISPFAYLQFARFGELSARIDITPVPVVFGGLLKHWGQLGPAEIPPKRRFVYRFFQKGKGGPRDREVHPGIVIDGPIEPLDGLLLHFPYPTLEDYFSKFNRYTSAAARDRLRAGKRARWIDRFLSPPARFLRTYFLRLGFLDGYQGFVLSVLGAFYVFARYTKMWQMQNAERLAAETQRLTVLDGRGGAAAPLRPPTH